MPLHVHLDPVGGVAGDMFIAALVDACPHLTDGLYDTLTRLDLGDRVGFGVTTYRDHALTGRRFDVRDLSGPYRDLHTPFRDIVRRVTAAPIGDAVKARAVALFETLADAEGRVHGIPRDEVEFHEVGAIDSIADLVGAAYLIESIGATSWSTAPVPMGSGQVKTSHGELPVPAPAVVELLRGFELSSDGIAGERTTPTGAAILRQLGCCDGRRPTRSRLAGCGTGFGTRTLPGKSNCLRALLLEMDVAAPNWGEVALLAFEVDDQSPEDLALGLDRLRATAGVLDVIQVPAYGKKGRLATQIQVLTRPEAAEEAAARCFEETTTIGLRWQVVRRLELEREHSRVALSDDVVSVKRVRRPTSGWTTKVESAELADLDGQAARTRLRREIDGLASGRGDSDE